MAKKFTVKGKVIEQNEYYKVIQPDNKDSDQYYVFSKHDDNYYCVDTYKIIGAALLSSHKDTKTYTNYVNIQKFGRVSFNRAIIDSWETKGKDGIEQTKIKYINERNQKFIRYIDENGNLYKMDKKTQDIQQEDNLTM